MSQKRLESIAYRPLAIGASQMWVHRDSGMSVPDVAIFNPGLRASFDVTGDGDYEFIDLVQGEYVLSIKGDKGNGDPTFQASADNGFEGAFEPFIGGLLVVGAKGYEGGMKINFTALRITVSGSDGMAVRILLAKM